VRPWCLDRLVLWVQEVPETSNSVDQPCQKLNFDLHVASDPWIAQSQPRKSLLMRNDVGRVLPVVELRVVRNCVWLMSVPVAAHLGLLLNFEG